MSSPVFTRLFVVFERRVVGFGRRVVGRRVFPPFFTAFADNMNDANVTNRQNAKRLRIIIVFIITR